MFRNDCMHFLCFDLEGGNQDLHWCRLACNKHCNEGPMTMCKDYEIVRNKKIPEFIEEEDMMI